jgi:hypothetical protein
MTDENLNARIEALFATADAKNVRHVSRELEQLVRQVADAATRRRYEAAIDALPDMVAHDGGE